jgi:hypothetical protein
MTSRAASSYAHIAQPPLPDHPQSTQHVKSRDGGIIDGGHASCFAFARVSSAHIAYALAVNEEVTIMTVPRDPFLNERPFPPEAPRDPNARTVVDESERGEDEVRDGIMDTLTNQPSRPLTGDEKEAAEHDHGRPARVYAPASARVAKAPAPGDDRLIEEGLDVPPSPEATAHPGDRSDPSELR